MSDVPFILLLLLHLLLSVLFISLLLLLLLLCLLRSLLFVFRPFQLSLITAEPLCKRRQNPALSALADAGTRSEYDSCFQRRRTE